MDRASKRLLQLVAFHATDVRYHELAEKITRFGIRQSNGRALTQTLIRSFLAKWEEQGLLIRSSKKPEPALMDTLVREGLSGDNSHRLLELARTTDRWSGRDAVLAFYVAFYTLDADEWKQCRRVIADASLPLLSSFCKTTFEQLTPEFQQAYYEFVIPSWIAMGDVDEKAVSKFRQLIDDQSLFPLTLLPRLLEWAVASGDRALLEGIHAQTAGKIQDVEGCLRLLQGNFDGACELLSGTLSNRANKRALTKLGGLPSVLTTLPAIASNRSVTREQALKATTTALKPDATPYADAFAIAQLGLLFISSPGDAGKLISKLNSATCSPLAKWAAGYLQTWLATAPDGKTQIGGLIDAGNAFKTIGCDWLAAIAMVAGVNKTTATIDSGSEPTERLIYEIIHHRLEFQLDVFHQLRKGAQWSKGCKVALARLFHQHSDPDFAFLTPEDRAFCQSLRHWTERGSYGYPEEHAEFETRAGARALIGHPRIFHPDKREEPLEIVEKTIALVVREVGDS